MAKTEVHSSLHTADRKRWAAPRVIPWRPALAALLVLAVLGAGAWYLGWGKSKPETKTVVAAPVQTPLSDVQVAGVSSLLNQFTHAPHEVRGTITDGPLKATITSSVTSDGRFGFGTINTAGVDASTLLDDGVVYVKGSPTFWSALGVQTTFPGWVKIHQEFLSDRIYLPAATIGAALAPVERARILGNDYTPGDGSSAVFSATGLDKVSLAGYTVTFAPADDAAVNGTAHPMIDALGPAADMDKVGSLWSVTPPPPPGTSPSTSTTPTANGN